VADVIYRGRPIARKWYLLPFILWALATTGLLLTSKVDLDRTQVSISVIAPGSLFAIWWLGVLVRNWRGTVVLTRETLRIGPDQVAVADIEPEWVRMLAARADPQLAVRVGGEPELPADRLSDRRHGLVLGGVFGSTAHDDLVTLEVRNQRTGRFDRVSVPTRDRRGLLAGLVTALEQRV
jgi:hypothetical protein